MYGICFGIIIEILYTLEITFYKADFKEAEKLDEKYFSGEEQLSNNDFLRQQCIVKNLTCRSLYMY